MTSTPFLTLMDSRAKLKGSRDPLGLQPIWTYFGRRVIRNLTTVTTSLRGFTTLLLGLYFAERAVEDRQAQTADFVDLFLKFEQLAAYSRVAHRQGSDYSEEEVRGIQRVKKNLNQGKGQVRISAAQDAQILANQKTYGLWGLYSVAARNSGWLESQTSRLTPIARDFVETQYLPHFGRDGDWVFPFLRSDLDFEPHRKHAKLSKSLAGVLGSAIRSSEVNFYSKHLLDGQVFDIQAALWRQIKEVNEQRQFDYQDGFGMAELREIIKHSRSNDLPDLAERLGQIQVIESGLGPLGRLLGFVLARDGQPVAQVAAELKTTWGPRLRHLEADVFTQALATGGDKIDAETLARLSQAISALAEGRYEDTIQQLLFQNGAVMKTRGGDAWVKIKGLRLDVRFREEDRPLPAREELPDLWTNSYFLNALKIIGFQIQAAG